LLLLRVLANGLLAGTMMFKFTAQLIL